MPPALLERLALELLRVLVFVVLVFVLIFGPLQKDDDLELQAQRADRSFDGAHLDRAQQQQHIDKLKLLHIPRRLRIDRPLHVGWRSFQRHLSARIS